jgi:hypothetical protein
MDCPAPQLSLVLKGAYIVTMSKSLFTSLALGLALTGLTVTASARPRAPRAVPEISGQHVGVGLAIVLGGAAVVLGRRRKKTAA